MSTDIVPFDENGNMLWWAYSTAVWRKNDPFDRTMTLDGTRRGQSAAKFIWVDERGCRYEMFLTHMVDLMHNAVIENGVVRGKWIIAKKGANYGIKYVGEADADS